jgi:diguanylate cyclase (GGDEF)-like protein
MARPVLVGIHGGSGNFEPDTEARAALERELGALGFRCRWGATLAETLAILAAERPAALVLQPVVADAATELAALRGAAGAQALPPFVLLGCEQRLGELVLSAARASDGPWDVTRESAPARELAARLGRLVAWERELAAVAELRRAVRHDERTGLLRAEAFEARLTEHVSAAERHGFELALFVLDLDRFGEVNKRHAHTTGDALIAAVGAALGAQLRAEDCAGRLGGDEFGVILPYTSAADAALVAERLLAAIRRVEVEVPGGTLAISASLGAASLERGDGARGLRARAEAALRRAKLAGGDRVDAPAA